MKPFTYLLIDFLTIIICLIYSFDKRIQFNKQFYAFLKAAILAGIPFTIWDIWFAAKGIWWFNSDYTIGFQFLGLPIEEWLFFLCIPFSCIFTFFCLEKFLNLAWMSGLNNLIVFISLVVLIVVSLLHSEKTYTLVTAIATSVILVYLHFVARVEWIGRASFIFCVLMLGFLPVNGVLTGTGLTAPIVNYNPQHFLGIRILTIPIEDAVYGYGQFLLTVYFFKIFQNRTQPSLSISSIRQTT